MRQTDQQLAAGLHDKMAEATDYANALFLRGYSVSVDIETLTHRTPEEDVTTVRITGKATRTVTI